MKSRRSFHIVLEVQDRRGDPACQCVGLIHARRAAKGATRKLIEQKQQRQGTVRCEEPTRKVATRRSLAPGHEALTEEP